MEIKKKNILNILIWALVGLCLVFAILTSIIVNYKQKENDKLYEENEKIIKIIGDNTENDEEASN